MIHELLTVVLISSLTNADVQLTNGGFAYASIYQDNMVLQRKPHAAVLWGYGMLGATVRVSLDEEVYTTDVFETPAGVWAWKVILNPQKAGGPHTIKASQVTSTVTEISLINVLFGDVWICSGQSNMAVTVPMVINASKEIEETSRYPNIRIMTATEVESGDPEADLSIRQNWVRASPESVGGPGPWTGFSAVCWFFGRYLYDKLGIPVGLIAATWGGTTIEPWTSSKALEKCGIVNFKPSFPPPNGGFWIPTNNSGLWNSMIHPMLNMTIKGAIWYQGESNVGFNNHQYPCTFPSMIQDWRRSWYEGTGGQTHSQFPFGFVQLSTHDGPDSAQYPMLRWHQTGDYGYVPNLKMPNTFMAVAMDLGDFDSPEGSVHPRYKQDVSSRLVTGALHTAYDRNVDPQGPIPESADRIYNDRIRITYSKEQKLDLVSTKVNFEVCCSSSACLLEDAYQTSGWFGAPISSISVNESTVTVDGKACKSNEGKAVVVRYAWSLSPCDYKTCSIYNNKGLPAPPFVISVTNEPDSSSRLCCNVILLQCMAAALMILQN